LEKTIMQFQAAVLRAPKQPLTLETVEIGELQPSDVLVHVRASGLCHTDLEVIEGTLTFPFPIVLGHEVAGVVEAVGSSVTTVAPGDHVICSANPHCGQCFYCERDQPILCEAYTQSQAGGVLLDGKPRLRLNGKPLHHMMHIAGYAEYCVVPESGAIPVSKDIPFDCACIIGCGVITGAGAVARIAEVQPGANVLVLGCGAVGLNVVQAARLAGAQTIIAVDRQQERLDLAHRFGADVMLKADDDASTILKARAATHGRGADFVFEAVGNESAFGLAAELVRPGGELIFLGKVQAGRQVSFRWGSLMGEKRITRSSYGGARPRRDFPWLVQSFLKGKIDLESLITRRISLDQINAGFDDMRAGKGIRTVVMLP
jgi:S-(hydroxymethyl)glutathione dehydrogenase/alcohol dehydrogenase